jgi:hypothetical protein
MESWGLVVSLLLFAFLARISGLQLRDSRPEERVAGTQMVVEERKWAVLRHRHEPKAELGEIHGERVEVDAVDARLGHPPLPIR